jgi:hypothetical protein
MNSRRRETKENGGGEPLVNDTAINNPLSVRTRPKLTRRTYRNVRKIWNTMAGRRRGRRRVVCDLPYAPSGPL